ncbi:hypothetical protein H0H87_007046, partial [Tephrocybe sp. NHM501043]
MLLMPQKSKADQAQAKNLAEYQNLLGKTIVKDVEDEEHDPPSLATTPTITEEILDVF